VTPQGLMLEGVLKEAPGADDGLLRKLRKEKQQLEDDLRDARQELDDARTQNERLERSMRNLRQQLSPLHRGLRALFGEIELAVGEEQYSAPSVNTAAPSNSTVDPRWESWKQTMPGRPAEMIDLLLLHKSMQTKALMSALHCSKDTVYNAARKLSQAGLLATSQPYSLKELQ
jgi:hypothetical protein